MSPEKSNAGSEKRFTKEILTEAGYSATYLVEGTTRKLSIDDRGYLSEFTVTEEGIVFESLQNYNGKYIGSDLERRAHHTQEAQKLFDEGKLAVELPQITEQNELDFE